ncbi:MarR family transcriptional regulator [Candidatus Sumerlaeota bacterium]|nr:MarR family transcriptional regulator [Candidatus Sumerlaeota bacterium]
MSKPTPEFTLDELIKTLGIRQSEGEGLTVRELTKATGWSRSFLHCRLRDLIEKGIVEVVRKQITRIDGYSVNVPAYRLREEKSKNNQEKRRRKDRKEK